MVLRSYRSLLSLDQFVHYYQSTEFHLKLGHRFHALSKVCSDRNNTVPLKKANLDNSGVWSVECRGRAV